MEKQPLVAFQNLPDEELLLHIALKDSNPTTAQHAFSEFHKRFIDVTCRIAQYYKEKLCITDPMLVETAVHNALMKVWEKPDALLNVGELEKKEKKLTVKGWLATAVYHQLVDGMRRMVLGIRYKGLLADWNENSPLLRQNDEEDESPGQESRERAIVQAILNELPPEHRFIFLEKLRYTIDVNNSNGTRVPSSIIDPWLERNGYAKGYDRVVCQRIEKRLKDRLAELHIVMKHPERLGQRSPKT
jgi:DNA-directed RNA polymerase specialized sigma24 family protein